MELDLEILSKELLKMNENKINNKLKNIYIIFSYCYYYRYIQIYIFIKPKQMKIYLSDRLLGQKYLIYYV